MKEVTLFLLSSVGGVNDNVSSQLPLRPLCGKPAIAHLHRVAVQAGVQDIRILSSSKNPIVGIDGELPTINNIADVKKDTKAHVFFLSDHCPLVSADSLKQSLRSLKKSKSMGCVFAGSDDEALPAALWSAKALQQLKLNDRAAPLFNDKGLDLYEVPDDESLQLFDNHTWVMINETLRLRVIDKHLKNGVMIVDPMSTHIEDDVVIGKGSTILPFTVIMSGVNIGKNCEVGPFTHLRKGATLKNHAEVGNFTEMKNTTLGEGSKAKHLSYLGDATIGNKVNIGAGTITANYDGVNKHKTDIANNAFIGSGSILVAPLSIGQGATTGAGAVVLKNRDVAQGETVVGVPARTFNIPPLPSSSSPLDKDK